MSHRMRQARPDSPVTRLRRWLANRIQVSPAPGEAWCLRCQLNGRHTLIVNADSWTRHARQHNAELPGVPIRIQLVKREGGNTG